MESVLDEVDFDFSLSVPVDDVDLMIWGLIDGSNGRF